MTNIYDTASAGIIDTQTKLDAVERELGLRRRVYPRQIDAGRMSKEFARDQIAIFEAIATDYRQLAAGERLL